MKGFVSNSIELLLLVLSVFVVGNVQSEHFADRVVFPRLPNALEKIENDLCRQESTLFVQHLNNFTLWAQEMWDASVKYPSGVLRGNKFQLGNMEECLSLNGPYNTQFCLVTLNINVPQSEKFRNRDPYAIDFDPIDIALPKLQTTHDISQINRHSLVMGLCVPESCSRKELENFYNEYVYTLDHPLQEYNVSYNVSIPPQMCQTKTEVNLPLNVADIIFCVITISAFLLVLISSFYDYFRVTTISDKKPKRSTAEDLILSFSAIKHYKSLAKAEDDGPLKVLYGIKVISIFTIVMCHRVGVFLSGPIINYDYIEHAYRTASTWIIYRGDMFVDTFFVMSGTLATYGLLNHLDKKSTNPIILIVLRYIRLTPVYAYVIFYYITLFFHFGSGPLWKLIAGGETYDCTQNWWTNILYISNYVNDDHMCMGHSWYLPCDFHYFILCLAVTFLIHRNKKLGLTFLSGLFILSVAIPFVVVVLNQEAGFLQFYPDFLISPKANRTFRHIYTKSHMRATPYVIGMITGYAYYKMKDSQKKLSRKTSHSITAISILFICTTIVGGFPFYNRYREYSAIESGAYASFHRVLWGAGTAGLLFTASYGHASMIRSILSWSPFVPLSKLVYGVYLVHMNFQIRSVGMKKLPDYYDYLLMLSYCFGDVVLSFIVAFFLYLGIEGPVKKVFTHLFFPPRPHRINNNTKNVDANSRNVTDNDSKL